MLTWRAPDTARMESVRVQLSGHKIRANGRMVAAAAAEYPAFAVYYDLQTDDAGATRRLGITVTLAERERQLSIARDEENMWLVTDFRGESRAAFDGALDVDVMFSPFFSTLPIRRNGLHERAAEVTVPVICVHLPELAVAAVDIGYRSRPGRPASMAVSSPAGEAAVTVDADGFIVDYPGLAERI